MRYEIKQDEYPDNPRECWDHVAVMVCFHNRYSLGDEHNLRSDMFGWWDDLHEHLVENEGAALIKPLYLYDHSGITISTSPFSCPWDSGQVGFVYMTQKDIDHEWGGDMEKAEKYMDGEVAEYDQYLTGDVWNIAIYDDEGEVLDSCHGLFGYDYAEEEAQRLLENYKQKQKETEDV